MSFKDLTTNVDLISYITKNRDRCAFTGDQWLFIQIPNAFHQNFARIAAEIIQPDYWFVPTTHKAANFDEQVTRDLKEISKSDVLLNKRLLAGYFKLNQCKVAEFTQKWRLFTIIRDPIDRLIANFNSQIAGMMLDKEAQVSAFRTFVRDVANQNVYAQFLTRTGSWSGADNLSEILDDLDFIGIYEDFPLTSKVFTAMFGLKISIATSQQAELANSLVRQDLTEQDLRGVAQLNQADYYIYKNIHDAFVASKDRIFAPEANKMLYMRD